MTQPLAIANDPGEYSRESREWLSTMIKVGFTEARGQAWHYREGDENHYPGAVPLEVVHDLFDFEITQEPVTVAGRVDDNTVAWYSQQHDTVFGYFSPGAKVHPYNEWLVGNTGVLLGGELEIGGAGLLKNRAVAYLQAELPGTVEVASAGEAFRGSVLAFTSLDGSLATNYQIAFTRVVCDNTFRRARREDQARVKIKHTRNSDLNFDTARDALGLLAVEIEAMTAEIERQTSLTVTPAQWTKFLDFYVPVPEEKGRGKTMAENRRQQLEELWATDERVAPWSGTAWGVQQAVNTYNQHLAIVKSVSSRFERNMLNVASGKVFEADDKAMKVLAGIS
jgi:phage/plasmid-like protein (TIGR03299 family)